MSFFEFPQSACFSWKLFRYFWASLIFRCVLIPLFSLVFFLFRLHSLSLEKKPSQKLSLFFLHACSTKHQRFVFHLWTCRLNYFACVRVCILFGVSSRVCFKQSLLIVCVLQRKQPIFPREPSWDVLRTGNLFDRRSFVLRLLLMLCWWKGATRNDTLCYA